MMAIEVERWYDKEATMRHFFRSIALALLLLAVDSPRPAAAQTPGPAMPGAAAQNRLVVFEAFMRPT